MVKYWMLLTPRCKKADKNAYRILMGSLSEGFGLRDVTK
jgi:hypothetical protein